MSKWVWHIGFAAMCGIIAVACSDKVAGSSFETENSVAVVVDVQQGNGAPAARTKVLVRPSVFLAGANNLALSEDFSVAESDSPVVETDSAAGILNLETDDQGRLMLPRLKSGKYIIEARQESDRAVAQVVVTERSLDSVSMTVTAAGSMEGRVWLPSNLKTVTVGIQGLDYFVQTDSLGNFEFENLPAGEFSVIGFDYKLYSSVEPDGSVSTFSSYMSLGSKEVKVTSAEPSEKVVIGQRRVNPTPTDTATVEPEDVYPIIEFEDFEDSTYGWYTSVSKYGVANLSTTKAGLDREGLVAHLEYSNDSNYNWVLMGYPLRNPTDFSSMDSVAFWARGTYADSSQWISLSFDVLMDSTSGYENGKSWVHITLDTAWTRYVVTPGDLLEADSMKTGGNLGWDVVKDHVTNLNFFGGGVGGPFEFWLDDIVIYGVKELE